MKEMSFKLSVLIFMIALLSGFYLRLPLLDNLIRAFVIYLVFSIVILLTIIIYNQSALSSLKSFTRDLRSHSKHSKNQPATKTTD